MSASYPTRVLLAFRSGDRCAFPGCDRALTVDSEGGGDPAITGQAAHIAGEQEGAARFDPSMSEEQRDHYSNLIYMCRDHHAQIDQQETDFPVARLLAMKANHEAKIREAVNQALPGVGFPELQKATRWVVRCQPIEPSSDYSVTPPEGKLRKNDLSSASRLTITMGLSVAREVRAFVEAEARVDADFPERLKVGFLQEYYRLRHDGHRGDDLFDLMCRFSQRGMADQATRSAGLAVLVYLFEACEVFEK